MDRKSILVIVLCVVVIIGWNLLINKFYPPPVRPPGATNSASAQNVESNNLPATTNVAAVAGFGTNGARFTVNMDVPEHEFTLTNANARYVFTSRGGGLKDVELTGYLEEVSTIRKKAAVTTNFASLHTPVTPPVMAILGTGNEAIQGDGVFTLVPTTNGVRAEKTLTNGLTLVKDFQAGSNYLMNVSARIENHSAQTLTIPPQQWVSGTATPMNIRDSGQFVTALWYNGQKLETVAASVFHPRFLIFFPATPRPEYTAGNSNVLWTAVQNQFFTLATMPKNPASEVVMREIDLPRPTSEELKAGSHIVAEPKGYETALTYPAVTLKPGETYQQEFTLYAGPKEYKSLVRIGETYNNSIDLVMGFGGFIGNFAKGLLKTMKWMHERMSFPYGWAIVTITVLIKLIFWPLTQYSTRSMKKMAALGPQLKAIQEKFKDDPQKQQSKTWELYKKNKVNPVSGCLPMFLQLPLLYGFYRMLQSAIELRGAPFLWIGDLSRPDTVWMIPGFNFPVNPTPLIMGATMLWQSHMTPVSPGMDPTQQKMMRYMPLIFLLFMYNASSGLALYWTVQNLLTVLQTKLTRTQTDPVAATAKTPAPVAPQKKK